MSFDLMETIQAIGYLGIFLIVIAESGLFFGFLLPGDSLLFTAGFLASQEYLSIVYLVPFMVIGAILGGLIGYWTGKKFGTWLLKRRNSFLFHKKHLVNAEIYYKKHGAKTLVLSRFIPVFRTFVPIVAGMAGMEYKSFFIYNAIGGIIWGAGMTLAGYFLGETIGDVKNFMPPIIGFIVVLSIIVGLFNIRNEVRKYVQNHTATRKIMELKKTWLG